MSRFATLLWYDFKLAIRDKQNIAFSFLLPVLLMVLLGFAFGRGVPFSIHVGVVDNDHSELSKAATSGMGLVDGIRLHTGSEKEELAALRNGDRTAVAVFPSGFQYGTVGF